MNHPNALRVFVASLLLLVAPACRSPMQSGAGEQFVGASRAAHDLWAERLKGYFAADEKLDPLMRDQLTKSVDDWEKAIEAAEELIKPAVPFVPVLPASGVPR